MNSPTKTLNDQQRQALQEIQSWLRGPDKFHILAGYAGTGKSFLLGELIREEARIDGGLTKYDICATAPTNKASKVLRKTIGSLGVTCKTIYSVLTIKMTADEDKMELTFPEKIPDISEYRLIVIDEASVISTDLCEYIKYVSDQYYNVKWLFVGDPLQLPPVGEKRSIVWKLGYPRSILTKVERNDDQLLALATHLRAVYKGHEELHIEDNHTQDKGVWKFDKRGLFIRKIRESIENGDFTKQDHTKILAWRNREVYEYNMMVRNQLFDNPKQTYVVGDQIMIAGPVQRGMSTLATVDDEGVIEQCDIVHHSTYREFKVYRMMVRMEWGSVLELNVIHESSVSDLAHKLNIMAVEAKANKKLWVNFWAVKAAFDNIRWGYSWTSHRSQGSTIFTAFVDSRDILGNSNYKESIRCLYVSITRPSQILNIL